MIGENWLRSALTAMALGIRAFIIIPLGNGFAQSRHTGGSQIAPLAALLAGSRVGLGSRPLLSSGLMGSAAGPSTDCTLRRGG